MRRYELCHARTVDSAGLVLCSFPGRAATSPAEAEALLSVYDYVPVIAALPLPGLDVSTLYARIDPASPAVLLESLGPGRHARYSIIAYNSCLTIAYSFPSAPLRASDPLDAFIASVHAPLLDYHHYYGGPICAWAYDAGLAWQGLPIKKSGPMAAFPDLYFFLPRQVMVYDHQEEVLKAICWISRADDASVCFDEAVYLLQTMLTAAREAASSSPLHHRPVRDAGHLPQRFQANMSCEHFQDLVRTAKEHIRCGDIFQAVVSQRWAFASTARPWDVYQELRLLNPSPYMFYLTGTDFTILGASPETQLRIEDRTVTIHPIAGTRRLSGDPIHDDAARQDLLADEKERAEHLMLVDLARNDIGRASVAGSVRVPQFMVTESYSHVAHLVSEVTGRLKPDLQAADAFQACFPAGTLTGAPKRKAMEIISALETESRGIYGGAVGYINFNGSLDSGIVIRTILHYRGTYYLQSGAGIVADSDPEKEYEETISKAGAMMAALLNAEEAR